MQKRYIITLCLTAVLLLSGVALRAQHKHEFSLYGGGGLSTLQYKAFTGKQQDGFGGHVGLGYHFFFAPKWGVGTGVEVAFYTARYKLGQYFTDYTTIDPEGASFEFRSTVESYKEKHRAALVQIPLMVQYQSGGEKRQFYAAAGGKVGLPVSGSYKGSTDEIRNSGYYAREDYEYTTQTFMGFGTFTDRRIDSDLELKTAFLASAEAGVKWRLNESWSLYTGAYLDYGLNNVGKAPESLAPFVAYNAEHPADFAVNSAFRAQDAAGGKAFAESKISPLAVGIKVRIAFGKGERKQQADEGMTETLLPPATAAKADSVPPVTPAEGTAGLVDPEKERAAAAQEEAAKVAEDAKADSAVVKAADEAARQAVAEQERLAKEQEQQRLAEAQKAAQEEAAKAVALAEAAKAAEEAKNNAAKAGEEGLRPVGGYLLSKTALTDAQRQEWDKNIAFLQRHPDMKFFIYGHTCNTGSVAVNERVGLQRAENAKAYLIGRGIAADRILGTASKRDTEPLVPNDTEPNRRTNRRVEVVLQ